MTERLFGLLRQMDPKRRLIVVVYHKVFPSLPHEFSDGLSPDVFRDQIGALKSLFDVRGPDEAVRAVGSSAAPPGRRYPLLVTFDDGFVNNLEHAVPILQEHSVPGLFFVSTWLVGTEGFLWTDEVRELLLNTRLPVIHLFPGTVREERHLLSDRRARLRVASVLKERLKTMRRREFEEVLNEIRRAARVEALPHHTGTRVLDWEEVRRMAACGMTIGSHSGHHFVVTRLSREELDAELEYSQRAIEEHVGEVPRYFAYPNGHPGDYDDRTAAQVAQAGITHAFTMGPGIASEDDSPLMLPRYCPSSEAGAVVALELLMMLAREVVRGRMHGGERRRPASVIPLRTARETRTPPLRAAS